MKVFAENEKLLNLEQDCQDMKDLLKEIQRLFLNPWNLLKKQNRTHFAQKIHEVLNRVNI